ncbi:sulfatase-like protein [Jejuia pallidilutea]|uniref:Sulfatase-like protein n=1 Tax=Jejuia pallidilutea TaxID=504487 RepID=A0A362X3M8_9FLAO|nr:sulfatase-like protein [Jejuia pallidilutea]
MSVSKILLFCSVILCSCNNRQKKPDTALGEKPLNVLMIAVDDLNGYLGYLGDPNAITPHMDTLAANGTFFTNAHCQAPLCGPSRASIMSGLRPSTTGIYGMIKDDLIRIDNERTQSITFLPEYFKNKGYETIGVGKLFHTFAPKGIFKGPGRFVGEKPNNDFGPAPKHRMNWPGYRPDDNKKIARTNTDWGAFPDQDSLVSDYKAAYWVKEQLEAYNSKKPFLWR